MTHHCHLVVCSTIICRGSIQLTQQCIERHVLSEKEWRDDGWENGDQPIYLPIYFQGYINFKKQMHGGAQTPTLPFPLPLDFVTKFHQITPTTLPGHIKIQDPYPLAPPRYSCGWEQLPVDELPGIRHLILILVSYYIINLPYRLCFLMVIKQQEARNCFLIQHGWRWII